MRIFLLKCLLALPFFSIAKTLTVKNEAEFSKANENAKAGDIIILKNGLWNNVTLTIDCNGTNQNPVTFKAETAGKVLITGNSKLKIGGSFLVVEGLYFTKGYAGNEPVIKFSIDKSKIANHCRLTNTVINDFNNPKRLDENYWIALYGKNNRIDHCSFLNKKNLGVLMAVILEDERSRENFHSIDHNYFGVRMPLASNAGEIIRVGVSQHCEFNSNTLITDNVFEHCDGETEIISIKSCHNIIRNNIFKECQGGVVLRHGHYNTVENNLFLGNNKRGTGGVRIINRGQWVVNNLFYKCRGEGFRSPISVMNGVPNSPANRYVPVTDAVIANNTFYECNSITLCEGSDTERSVPPKNVLFVNNVFCNRHDSIIYKALDNISGFRFSDILVSSSIQQQLQEGFIKTSFGSRTSGGFVIPTIPSRVGYIVSDTLSDTAKTRLSDTLSSQPGYYDHKGLLNPKAFAGKGAAWIINKPTLDTRASLKLECKTAKELIEKMAKYKREKLFIKLTGKNYALTEPLEISDNVTLAGSVSIKSSLAFAATSLYQIYLHAGTSLHLENLSINAINAHGKAFISTDTGGSSNHANLSITNCSVSHCNNFFHAAASSVLDSLVVNNSSFADCSGVLFALSEETGKKGYYNVELMRLSNTNVTHHNGTILNMARTGNDESTMGPKLIVSNNRFEEVNSTDSNLSLIIFHGIQETTIEKNKFTGCNKNKTLIRYEDEVRSRHLFKDNVAISSGVVVADKFVVESHNVKD